MVKIGLQISCVLENIESLRAGPSFAYFLKLRCNNCGESDDIWHDICEDERVKKDTRNAKGSNFVIKCKLCSRENSLDVVEASQGNIILPSSRISLLILLLVATYTEKDSGNFKGFVSFDCRGIEPIEFDARSGYIVKSAENGRTFEDVEIEDGDWTEYDDKNKNSVSIAEFKSQFVKLKGK